MPENNTAPNCHIARTHALRFTSNVQPPVHRAIVAMVATPLPTFVRRRSNNKKKQPRTFDSADTEHRTGFCLYVNRGLVDRDRTRCSSFLSLNFTANYYLFRRYQPAIVAAAQRAQRRFGSDRKITLHSDCTRSSLSYFFLHGRILFWHQSISLTRTYVTSGSMGACDCLHVLTSVTWLDQ